MKEKKIFKTFRTIVIKAGDEEGVIDILIPMSTGSVDRHHESIDPKGWKKHLKAFKKRAIMTSSHSYHGLQNQIGEFLDLQVTEEGLFARPKYYINKGNPEADWGYFLATKGKAAYSVGFIPIKWEDSDGKDGKPTRKFTEQELIEIAHVIVPSNRDAIQGLQAKAEDPVIKQIIDEIIEDKDFFMGEKDEATKLAEIIIKDAHGKEFIELILEKEVITKPEETDDFVRIPAKGEEGKHKGHKIRWVDIDSKKGIRGIYCVDCKKIITYVFAKDKGWTMAKAKKWMEDNEKIVTNYYMNIDLDSLKDLEAEEIDWYEVKASIEKEEKEDKRKEIGIFDINELANIVNRNKELVKEKDELKEKLKDLELKAGAVLNAKNKKDLKDAQALIQSVLDSAGEEEGKEGESEKDNEKDDKIIIVKDSKKEDPGKGEKEEEKTIIADEKIISEAVTKALNYTLGINK